MASRPDGSIWLLPVVTLIGGVVAGVAFGLSFVALHSNWKRLAWVTPDAESTAPFYLFAGLIPIVVSVGWIGLILHARGQRRWSAVAAGAAALEIGLLAFSLLPLARAGNGGVWASNVGLPALALVLFGAPIASAAWPTATSRLTNVWPHLVGALVLPIAVYVSFTLAGGHF